MNLLSKYLEILNYIDANKQYNHAINIFGDFSGSIMANDKEVAYFETEKELYMELAKIKASIEFDTIKELNND